MMDAVEAELDGMSGVEPFRAERDVQECSTTGLIRREHSSHRVRLFD
jgi:hypothetical protein